jgi:hypothetical protein
VSRWEFGSAEHSLCIDFQLTARVRCIQDFVGELRRYFYYTGKDEGRHEALAQIQAHMAQAVFPVEQKQKRVSKKVKQHWDGTMSSITRIEYIEAPRELPALVEPFLETDFTSWGRVDMQIVVYNVTLRVTIGTLDFGTRVYAVGFDLLKGVVRTQLAMNGPNEECPLTLTARV